MYFFHFLRRRARLLRRALGHPLKFRILLLTGFLLLLMFLHVVAMVLLEGIGWGDAAWLTITTATTVGYGDISAATTAGRWATVLLMYAGGIFVLAQLAGLVFEAAQASAEQRLSGKIQLRGVDHVVIFGWREDYLTAVVKEIRTSMLPLADADIFIVSPSMGRLPEELRDLEVQHVAGPFYDPQTLDRACVDDAARFVIIPNTDEYRSDFVSGELTDRLHERCPTTPIVVSCLQRDLEPTVRARGAQDTMTFDVNYPDMLARAVLSLGAENVVDELISESGAEMIIVQHPLVCRVEDILRQVDGRAILVGFRRLDGTYTIHPPRQQPLEDEQLIFLVDVDRYGNANAAQKAISKLIEPLAEDRPILQFREPEKVGLVGISGRVTSSYLRRLQSELRGIEVDHLCNDFWSVNFGTEDIDRLQDLDAVIVLADDPKTATSDAKTYLTIRHLREVFDFKGRIIAEAVLPENRPRFEARGANDVLRPVNSNLDIIARCVLTGAEEVLDSLYSSYGTQELITVKVDTDSTFGEILEEYYDRGLALAFQDGRGLRVVPDREYPLGKGTLYVLMEKEEVG